MRADSGFLRWGVFLIALGTVPLAVAAGVLTTDMVRGWWTLWPLLLVVLGVLLLLRATGLAIAGVLVAAVLGLVLGSGLAGGLRGLPISGCGEEQGGTPFAGSGGELADGASVELEFNCGELNVEASEGSAWRFEGSGEEGEPPEVAAAPHSVTIQSSDDGPGFGFLRARERWNVTLPTTTLDLAVGLNAARGSLALGDATLGRLDVSTNAGEVRVDLVDANELEEIEVEVNAGSATILLPDASLEGQLGVNAGSIDLCLPEGVGLQVRMDDNVTASNNFEERGLARRGDAWETPDFEAAGSQIVLDADVNAASIELNPDEGCRPG